MNLIEKTIITSVGVTSLIFNIVIFYTMRNEHHQALDRAATNMEATQGRIDTSLPT